MNRLFFYAIIFLLLLGMPAIAQQQPKSASELQPFARVNMHSTEVAIGKPVKVTLTLMVPTMFRIQPDFPDYDGINVIVKTSGPDLRPVTRFVNGRQWMGTSQTYFFYPMQQGQFAFEPENVSAMYTDPVNSTTAIAEFNIKGFGFSAIVPAGAEELDPLIVADALTLQQSWDGPVDGLTEGEAITRNISATIEGSSALFLPTLISQHDSQLIKAYPQTDDVNDTDGGTSARGTRSESTTYVARYGGEVVFPDVAISWFNSVSGEVETATVEGRSIIIDATPVPVKPLVTRKQALVLTGLLLCVLAMGWAYSKFIHPSLVSTIDALRLRWKTSEPYAARNVEQAIQNHQLDAVYRSLLQWLKHQKVTDDETRKAFLNALLAVGRERFGAGPQADWHKLEQTFQQMRKTARAEDAKPEKKALPELNPF